MKLDETIVQAIVKSMKENYVVFREIEEAQRFVNFLREIDLVVKPGDSSQSVLVENKNNKFLKFEDNE